ncbi:unnamed protein product [Cyclocybe aegerita]|uniref:Uncharacterized protein n=1 Tax=Cyclocybe aegerita TaxID=1973307 RepID=A0A8S0VYC4_CYCAE|nr:unnamed protein product [Cyclocybe aegerita]
MPVTFKVASHAAKPVERYKALENAEQIVASTWGTQYRTQRVQEVLQSSVHKDAVPSMHMLVNENGFVNTVVSAYNAHHNLVIRPDDVWIAILSQFNLYVNAHAEELRSLFVAHEGKKKLVVRAIGTRYTVNFGALANQMTNEIHNNVVDKGLKDWILPDFSTTSHNDTVICAVLMMATLKAYFSYRMQLCCGIPSVTLEGTKSDWEKLLARIDKLTTFGAEPTAWVALLRPILRRFVDAFDGHPDVDFWGRVCHYHSQGSGTKYLSGWITAFCVWDSKGKWQGPSIDSGMEKPLRLSSRKNIPVLELDGVQYRPINSSHVPPAYCEVDVELDDNGDMFDCVMVSGHVAALIEGEKKDTLRPRPEWFIFIKEECEDPTAEMRRKLEAIRAAKRGAASSEYRMGA